MNINKLMKQAQEMQKKMVETQEKLKEIEVEASAGGGMVTARMNGGLELLDLEISDEVFNMDDRDMMKDLIISAVNEAKRKAEEMGKEEMAKITGGMNIPGM